MTSGTDTTTDTRAGTTTPGGIGESAQRPDGIRKVMGEFAYGSDLWMDGMLWGVTLRSPHPYARITRVDITARARDRRGVRRPHP